MNTKELLRYFYEMERLAKTLVDKYGESYQREKFEEAARLIEDCIVAQSRYGRYTSLVDDDDYAIDYDSKNEVFWFSYFKNYHFQEDIHLTGDQLAGLVLDNLINSEVD